MVKIKPVNKDFFGKFDENACTLCGECFTNCPVIDLSLEESKKEMERLVKGRNTKHLLSECQSCFTCNFYCPENAKPTSLILQRWHEQYKEEGLKKKAEYYMTLHPHYPNFRSYVMERLPQQTKKLVKSWASLKPIEGDTLTFPGCNIITYAELTQTSLFQDLEIRGRLEYCCGETLFRTGYKDKLQQITKRLDKWLNTLKPQNLIVLCTAGTNVFQNVLPQYGLTYQFDSVKSYIQYIWEQLESGKIKIQKELDITVTIQESCYAKMFGERYMDLPRKILNKIGVSVVEIEKCRENMRCCGIAGGFSVNSSYSPTKIMKSVFTNMKSFKKTKADAICVYCAGCLATLLTPRLLYPKKYMKVYHIIELLQMAIGEEPISAKTKQQRAKHFFWGILKHQLPKTLSRKEFRIEDIPEDPPPYGEAW
ncbi:MAG: (Fe-S)-binding protein [Promethearchaeia archaeon]